MFLFFAGSNKVQTAPFPIRLERPVGGETFINDSAPLNHFSSVQTHFKENTATESPTSALLIATMCHTVCLLQKSKMSVQGAFQQHNRMRTIRFSVFSLCCLFISAVTDLPHSPKSQWDQHRRH